MKPTNGIIPLIWILLLLLGIVHLAYGLLIDEEILQRSFQTFKNQYGRQYRDSFEENYRKSVFAINLEFILQHNRANDLDQTGFRVAINNFTDLSNEEFVKQFVRYRPNIRINPKTSGDQFTGNNLPDSIDWTTKNAVTPVKNQGQCGSASIFAPVAAIEGAHAIQTGQLVALSEQNVADCAPGNHGCNGGFIDDTYKYVIDNHGIDTESGYPTNDSIGTCHFKRSAVGATISSYMVLPPGSESSLQFAIATVGPVSVGIDASEQSFQFYASGVYDEPSCTQLVDHAVAVVGYGTVDGQQFWKVKNSWGNGWGMDGYILMSRNKNNQCGIASMASYPVV